MQKRFLFAVRDKKSFQLQFRHGLLDENAIVKTVDSGNITIVFTTYTYYLYNLQIKVSKCEQSRLCLLGKNKHHRLDIKHVVLSSSQNMLRSRVGRSQTYQIPLVQFILCEEMSNAVKPNCEKSKLNSQS